MRLTLSLLMLLSAMSFGLGITLPIVKFEKLFFFTESPSLIDLVTGLWSEANYLLSATVLLFSIVFPLTKLSVVFIGATDPQTAIHSTHIGRWMGLLSKWSMMDVLLVALAVFAAKSSGLATAIALPGIWFYSAAAIGGAICAGLLKRLDDSQEGNLPSGS